MLVKFWGTRGSIAKPGPTTIRYGGNTSCVEIRSDSGTLVVLDCGTGGHALGQHLSAQTDRATNGHMLISHTHWDHIQGIPFFSPLSVAGNTWDISGPKGLSQSLRTTLASQMAHTYFPITLDQFAATIRYHDLVEGTFSIGDIKVTTRYLNHPALTLGYRLEADGACIVYCCDHEPHSAALASGELPIIGLDRRHADFLAAADLVIHDAQYTAREYASKIGWGHSTVEYAVRVCQEAGVKKLALTHHDPLRDDAAVDLIVNDIRLRLRADGSPLEAMAAAEGLTVQLRGDPDRSDSGAKVFFSAITAIDSTAMAAPVLVCVADSQIKSLLAEAITAEGLHLQNAADSDELLRKIVAERPSLVIVEHDPPLINGAETVRALRHGEATDAIQIPVVLVATDDHLPDADRSGATDWIVAPFRMSYARTKIRAWVLRTACRWIRAKLPADERHRLSVLHDLAILDTPPEERFDRLTRIAAAAFNVPVALVTLVDEDRQWFKSCYGLQVRETERDLAFCSHVVQTGEEMVVPDTLLDDRFAEHPHVLSEPRIRFYAGAPLNLDNGSCIGTLCLIDTRPRELDQNELVILRDLRDIVLNEIRGKHS
jgi:ribonuclease BN (tRNA processing enzyme)/DNA-binding response OmpR family regulator